MSDGENEGQRDAKIPGTRKTVIRKHTDLDVYKRSFAGAMRIFFLSKEFPSDEKFSLNLQSSADIPTNTPPPPCMRDTTKSSAC